MTASPELPETPDVPETRKQARKPRRRVLVIGLAAAVVVGGAASISLIRAANRPFVLDTSWGAPTVIDAGAAGDPLALFKAELAKGLAPQVFGDLKLDPQDKALQNFQTPGDAAAVVTGAVPSWFLTLNGAVQLTAEFHGELTTGGDRPESSYSVRQLSLVATDRSITDIGDEIRDRLEDTWPEVDVIPGPGNYSIDAGDEWTGRREPGELEINLQTSPAFPGLVIVRVEADYLDQAPLRVAPGRFHGTLAETAAVAATDGWAGQKWVTVDGITDPGPIGRMQDATWSAAESDVVALSERLTGRLGVPVRGDADPANALLDYQEGYLGLSLRNGATLVRWRDDPTANNQVGPLAALKAGVPAATLDLDANPRTPDSVLGELTSGAAIEKFEQVGMLTIEGGVAVRIDSGARINRPAGTIEHQAHQLVVVDTPLTADEVSWRLQAALTDLGVANSDVSMTGGATLSDPVYQATVYTPGRDAAAGNGKYQVEVGSDNAYPGLVAIWIDLTVQVTSPLPQPPAFTADYYASVRKMADPAWTPSGWYIATYDNYERNGAWLRGDLDWTAGERGPVGLKATLAAVEDAAGVTLEPRGDHSYQDDDDENWLVTSFTDGRYEPVDIHWSGKSVAVTKAG